MAEGEAEELPVIRAESSKNNCTLGNIFGSGDHFNLEDWIYRGTKKILNLSGKKRCRGNKKSRGKRDKEDLNTAIQAVLKRKRRHTGRGGGKRGLR